MPHAAYRWMMNAPGAPMTREAMDIPQPGAGEVVVKIAGCGVCHTDLDYYYNGVRTNHPLPLALGHEISGHVIKAGAGAERWLDTAVIIPAVIPCGECDLCIRGKATICRAQKMPGYDIQGGFASHILVPARGLCPVDEARLATVGLELADVSVVADALTTPYQAAVQAGIGAGDMVVIIGAGGIGGYAVQVAAALGAIVAAIDIDPAKLAAITDHGPKLCLDPKDFAGAREIKKALFAFALANGLKSTEWVVMECSGSTAGQQMAFDLLVHGATLCVVGYTIAKAEFRLSNLMAYHARALGNWGCAPELYPEALELVYDGRVNVKNFVERHPLDAINDIFAAAHGHALARRAVLIP